MWQLRIYICITILLKLTKPTNQVVLIPKMKTIINCCIFIKYFKNIKKIIFILYIDCKNYRWQINKSLVCDVSCILKK